MAVRRVDPETPPKTPRGPRTRVMGGRQWTAVAAGAFIVVLVICAVLLTRSHGNTPGQPAVAGPNPIPPVVGQVPIVPGAPVVGQHPLTTAPAGTVWTLVKGIALPSSPGQGPSIISGDLARGYAHTATGALLAVVNTTYRVVSAGDHEWQGMTDANLTGATGVAKWRQSRSSISTDSTPGGTSDGGYSQVAGFQFLSYTPSDTVVQLISTTPGNGVLQTAPYHLVWSDGDWKLMMTDDGRFSASTQQVSSMADFIPWHGVA